jgi:hypothetical protein
MLKMKIKIGTKSEQIRHFDANILFSAICVGTVFDEG